MKSWLILILSGVGEIIWSVALSYTSGWTKLTPAVITFFFVTASFWGLSVAMKTIPLGTAYAVFKSIGVIGSVAYGIIVKDEPANFWRVFFLLTLIFSLIGLRAVS